MQPEPSYKARKLLTNLVAKLERNLNNSTGRLYDIYPAHLREGYAELIDSFGQAAQWHDKQYAAAILIGECTVQRWREISEG